MQHLSLEGRLAQLERRVRRQQLLLLALGVGAVVAVCATRALSQSRDKGRELTLTTLNIVGSDGRLRAVLSGDARLNKEGGSLALVDNAGAVRVGLMASKGGGSVSIFDASNHPTALLGSTDDEGALSLASVRSKSKVSVVVTPGVSGVVVAGRNGQQQFVAGADESGGMVQCYDFEGKLRAGLPGQ